MDKYKDTHTQSVLKAISWRILATTATISIVFAFTGKLVLSAGVGAVEIIVKLVLYYLHERVWLAAASRTGRGPTRFPARRPELEGCPEPTGDYQSVSAPP